MGSLQVIVKITEPTDWVNSIATPEKQRTGALRVYLDPRDLNCAVKRDHYPLPTLKELALNSFLTTFNTPFGRYRPNEVFQKTMDMAFEGIDGCKTIIDDMFVWGSLNEDHDNNLRKVLERTRDVGIKCSAKKCVFWSNPSELLWSCAIGQGSTARPQESCCPLGNLLGMV